MARPPLPLGHHGAVKVTRDDGRWVARCRVRDLDGVTRRVERWGSSQSAARRSLQDELRNRGGERRRFPARARLTGGERPLGWRLSARPLSICCHWMKLGTS